MWLLQVALCYIINGPLLNTETADISLFPVKLDAGDVQQLCDGLNPVL